MDLNEFASNLAAKDNFIKASFGGFAGSGKTRTATEFVIGAYKALGCTKPILIIDNEKGSRFLVPLFNKAGIQTLVKDTLYLADILRAFEFLNKGDIDFLFVDSLSKIWYQYVRDYKNANRKKFMTLQDWGKILPSWQEEFADKFVNLSGNCVFTGRGGYTYDMEENDETKKKEFVKSGVKMKMAGETPFEPDLNIWMDICQKLDDNEKPMVWREATILKDRSGLIDGKVFKNPTYKEFSPVVKFLIDVPKGDVAGATDNSNLAPSENYAAYEKKEQREILMDKLKVLFEKYGFGSSKEDKRYKALISEKFLGTASPAELQKIDIDTLRKGYDYLEDFMNGWEQVSNKDEYINGYKLPIID